MRVEVVRPVFAALYNLIDLISILFLTVRLLLILSCLLRQCIVVDLGLVCRMVDRRHISDRSSGTDSHLHRISVLVVRVNALLLSIKETLVVGQHLKVSGIWCKLHHSVVSSHLMEQFSVNRYEGFFSTVRRYQQLLQLLLVL